MTDAEKLTKDFVPIVREVAFRIAPERAAELAGLMGKETWYLDIDSGPVNFTAYPPTTSIIGTYAALLSLWAVAGSVRILMVLTQAAVEQGLSRVVITPGSAGSMAIELKDAASVLIRNEAAPWDQGLPQPDPSAPHQTVDGLVNNLFLASLSFIILHECAHIALGHQVYTSQHHDQEREADRWAADWMLEKSPDRAKREFRMLSICIAFIWIGLIDDIRQAGSTHPQASHRLGDIFTHFGDVPEDSLALEVTGYILKAFYDPATELPQADDALSAFVDRLIDYKRSS